MLPLLSMPLFFSATALKGDIPQQDQQAIIYVGENTVVFGFEESTNARIVKIEAPLKVEGPKKSSNSKIKKQIPITKEESVNQVKNLPKLSKPKFLFKTTRSDESFDSGSLSNTKNSVITPVFVSENIVSCLYIQIKTPVFVYLMNIYTADFSKTAALSQFLFSRPPPFFI